MSNPAPVAVALDAPDLETAARWAELVTPHVTTIKVGLELYLRYGPQVVATVRGASRVSVFLDLKLHDIPATVAGAARAVARLRPEGIFGLSPGSVKKKLKQKGFAAAVSRDDITRGAADLGVDLDEHIQTVIDAMTTIASQLGLNGAGEQEIR